MKLLLTFYKHYNSGVIMKKFLLFCLFFLQYQLTQTGHWQIFGPRIQLDPDRPIDTLTINSYEATPGEVYLSANQAGAESNFRVQSEYFAPLASRVVPISGDQLAVNRLRNPSVVLRVGLWSAMANNSPAPGRILIEESNESGQPVSRTTVETGFATDVTSLALSENGNFLCAGSGDGELKL
jgi:hypothetical protein